MNNSGSKDARVVMLNCNPNKSEDAIAKLKQEFDHDADVSYARMDLAELASIRNAATEVLEKVPHIDVLISNGFIVQIAKKEFTVDALKASWVSITMATSCYVVCSLSGSWLFPVKVIKWV